LPRKLLQSSKKEIIIGSMISSKHSRTYFDDDDDCDDAGRMESVHNYVAEDGAYPMQQEWTRKEVTMAIFQ
jgi:hypothetical protein